ncbi:Ig-like domain-containing protein [Flavobacterium sp. ASW18X]|uniref:Ig-like domain-containing protein n=1 Tax=Flavobacterium sp. ASW18X TaxID=2572595 RepID=UPI0010ADC908|nr:Ig-like domain-containing protein [Flavobacterium sp. ASW18X]TKD59014.1 Ig domain-containing protein [Flavobacterium sp. ASW18X]
MRNIKFFLLSSVIILFVSCENELEINTDDLRLNGNDLYLDIEETFNSKILPTNATMLNSTWESMNPDIASVEKHTGVITGVSNGKTTISVVQNDGYFTGELIVTVGYDRITDISIYPIPDLPIDSNYIAETNVIEDNPTETVIWESMNPEIATVDPVSGNISAISVGNANIRATLESNTNIFDDRIVSIID